MVTKEKDFEANSMLSKIYTAYANDFAIQLEEREKEKREKMAAHLTKKNIGGNTKLHVTWNQKEHIMLKTTNFIDRLINLNVTDAIAQGKKKNLIIL